MKRLWMIVEDDPVIRAILTAMLTLWDVKPLVFKDGFQVGEWLDKIERGEIQPQLPEIALLDIRMPGPLGHETGRRMRAIPATSQIPVIIMTAYHLTKEDRDQICSAAQPNHIIGKPFPSPDDLLTLIESTIAESVRKPIPTECPPAPEVVQHIEPMIPAAITPEATGRIIWY